MYRRTIVFCFLIVLVIFFASSFHFDKYTSIEIESNIQLANLNCNGPDTIFITIQDSFNIVNAKLFYAKNYNPWDSSLMVKTGANTWRGIMYLSGIATYRYYIKTFDSLNRVGTMPAGAPANYYSFICSGNDTIKPVITHTPIGNTPKSVWPISVSAAVSDASGIDSVWVRWRINSGITKLFRLLNTSGNNYSSIFNSVNAEVVPGDTIRYRIIAQDNSSQHNKDSTVLYSFRIVNYIGINVNKSNIPDKYYLSQNYPNPFNPITRLDFDIPKQGIVKLKIFDILGRDVVELVNEKKSPGSYSIDFNAAYLSSGVYLYKLESDGFVETKRMVLLK